MDERRAEGRKEGRKELREPIILFNHILDESQVIRATLRARRRGVKSGWGGGEDSMGEVGVSGATREVEKNGELREREGMRVRTGPVKTPWTWLQTQQQLEQACHSPTPNVHARARTTGGGVGGE